MCNKLENDAIKLFELRLDYTWKYFESAARQRMLFLNYFLIAVGILASAYGFALKEKIYLLAIYVCIFGLISSIGFIIFDIRMLAFVERALKVLETLEREELFKDGVLHATPLETPGKQLGLARIEPDHIKSAQVDWQNGHMITKTKLWLQGIEGVAALGFLLGIILTIVLWANSKTLSNVINSIPSTQTYIEMHNGS